MRAGCIVLGLWWMLGAAQAQDPVRVGFICPFSGGSADFGTSARLGAELAVKEINEVGGYLGRPIELVARDDKANPDEGLKVSEELVQKEKVAFTVGFCNTGVAMKSLDIFQRNRHLLMVPVATGSAITATVPAAQSFVFRASARDTLQAGFIVDDIVRRGLSRVALLADTTGYGEGGFNDVRGFLKARKLAPVYEGRFAIGVVSLTEQMRAARAAGADAIVAYTVGPELAQLVRARADAGLNAPLFGPWPASFRVVWDRNGAAAEGVMMVQTIIGDTANERRSSFIARLRRHAGDRKVDSLMAAAQTYDAVHLMLRALFQSKGDSSGPALKAALESLERPYVGVVTTHDRPFSATDHDAFSANMIWLGVWRRGEIQFAYPADARLSAAVRRKQVAAPPR
jgi:branched-chain amino acid transport system substrate-binding protein